MTAGKILSLSQAVLQVQQWKDQGYEVVFSNGCFDVLHLGHVDYLERAKALADKLVVGINSDSSVSRLKGAHRPINPEFARARLIAALAFVDLVLIFEQDTPLQIIEALKPDVLVKGSDYTLDQIVGADLVIENGGRVQTLDLVEGFSTTKTLEKIKAKI
jgi:rfaE bifunctional protein nucleotidyltransferase chain/domain